MILSLWWSTHLTGQKESSVKKEELPPSLTGESPPPAPKSCFGRDDLIEEVVVLAEGLTPVALIGAGGIGKTSIALTVLHHDRVKERFGENRRFIRCDQFPATLGHLLNRLSKITGAGIENPEDLTPLRPFLSSKEMVIVLDNAESILDPKGTDAVEIYDLVEELSELPTLCLCITSRISTIPPECKTLEVPVLSMDAARRAFYNIYKCDKGSDLVNNILEQLDFHPLSITLLATVAHHNKWGIDRRAREWEERRTSVLQTRHKKSLAAAIELSLASPMFQELGPDARALLGVVAFFPQGVSENNIDWLLPTISNGSDTLDGFCVLSLTSRSTDGFITMLAPLRDYLSPKDPKSSPLLCAVKECYFTQMSVNLSPQNPGFGETRWIVFEDINVEHLLDVFTEIDANTSGIWKTCTDFMAHLGSHKPRLTLLAPKIEGLPDDHHCKIGCLIELSMSLSSTGNYAESKGVLGRALTLGRERGRDDEVALMLCHLSHINFHVHLCGEGIQQAQEALEIYVQYGDKVEQARCLIRLAWLFHEDGQLENAEQIASSFDWHGELFGIHAALALLFLDEERFDDTHVHAVRAKSYATEDACNLGYAIMLQALIWHRQDRVEEAKSEVLRAAEVFQKLVSSWGMERCKKLLKRIQETG